MMARIVLQPDKEGNVVATTRHKVQQLHNEQVSLRRISSGDFTRELDKEPLLN